MSPASIPVSKWNSISLADALDDDRDMIFHLTVYQKTLDFCQQLESQRSDLERLIARHLGILLSDFVLLKQSEWVWGSFNICLPIDINDGVLARKPTLPSQAILRIPLPFCAGEKYSPGNSDEKLRCEAATYIWLRQACPTIPIPRLLGMGFSGQLLTAIENESWLPRLKWHFRRGLAWLCGQSLTPFSTYRDSRVANTHHLLLEYIVNGDPLSSSWKKYRHDGDRRSNLYHGLANILLTLTKTPLPRIGSWTINTRGVISLTNRPLLDLTMFWNRQNIPANIPRNKTYDSAQAFILDLIAYHDSRIRFQPNSIHDRDDAIYQLSALTCMRALLPSLWSGSWNSTFVLQFLDLHQSNIFVDEQWNITGLIDFEFASVQPIQMVRIPLWLSDESVDGLNGQAVEKFRSLYDQFVDIIEEEETASQHCHTLSRQLRQDWISGGLWYNAAVRSSNGFPFIFEKNILPRYLGDASGEDLETLAKLWTEDLEGFIASKLVEKAQYEEDINQLFAVQEPGASKSCSVPQSSTNES